MAGAKSETAILTISTNFNFVSYDNDEGTFNVSLLDLISAWIILQF